MTSGHIKTITFAASVLLLVNAISGCSLFNIELDVDQDLNEPSRSVYAPARQKVFSPQAVGSPANDSDAVVTLLRYSRFISDLNENELRNEFKKINAANNIEQTNRGLLKMVVLLSLPQASFFNERKAEQLLNDFIDNSNRNTPALREYAHLLLSNLRQHGSHMKMYDELHTKLQLERKQRRKLQRKLEDLKTIEKSITKRQKEAGG